MVYHEARMVKGKLQNYLVSNSRENGKWAKESRFIGYGKIAKDKIKLLKEEFEREILMSLASNNLTKDQISKIENLKKTYIEKIGGLSKEEFEKFEHAFFTELTYNSNAIEGSSLSLEDTRLIVNEGITPDGKTLREINEAKNHTESIHFINSYKGDLNEELILRIHAIILKNISERFAGRYRETNVRIFGSDVHFPDAIKVQQLVKNVVYWYKKNKTQLHPLELAVVFSMKLVSIHPFIDGNGRVSRLVMNFILKKNGYPWINIYMKQRSNYLKAVRVANDEKYESIINHCILALEENLRSFKIIE